MRCENFAQSTFYTFFWVAPLSVCHCHVLRGSAERSDAALQSNRCRPPRSWPTMPTCWWWWWNPTANIWQQLGLKSKRGKAGRKSKWSSRRRYNDILYAYIYIYTVTTFKYVEGGPDREAPEVVWRYQFVYLNVVTVCLNELDSRMFKWPGGPRKTSPGVV